MSHPPRVKRRRDRERMPTWRIFRNLLVVSAATAVQFAVFGSSTSLLSSMRIEGGLGNNSQVILYACFIFGNFSIATACVRIFGMKNCVGGGMLMYSLSMVGNFRPTLTVFAITSVVNGLGAAVYWISVTCYVMGLAKEYGYPNDVEASKFAFVGIFVTFFGSSGIWGNLATSQFLTPDDRDTAVHENETDLVDISKICGVHFCDWYATGKRDIMRVPSNERVLKLSLAFIGCAIAASLGVFLFADPLASPDSFRKTSVKTMLLSTIVSLKDPYHVLLAPMAFVTGLAVCFHSNDFVKAFVSCTRGVSDIGLIMMAGGVTTTAFSVPSGFAAKKVDRMFFVIGGCLIAGGCYLAMALWTPSAGDSYFLYSIAAFWALSDTVFQGQLKAVYSVFFADNEEAAFATFSTFQNIGILAAYAYNSYACVLTKLLVLSGFLVLALIAYCLAECLFRRNVILNEENLKEFKASRLTDYD